MAEKLRVLGIGCHPDDLEIYCAGTLARYAAAGHTVIMGVVANGDKGHYEIPSEELARIRAREAAESAGVIGAQLIMLGVPDGQVYSDHPTRSKVIDLVRQARPDVVITHAPNDYFGDHTAVSELACDGSFLASAPLFETEHPACEKIPPVYFMDTAMGVGFDPQEYVDITETIETKLEMVSKHQSQLVWLRDHDGIDILDNARTVARFRGLQCGAAHAEAFRIHAVWGRQLTRRMLP
jgi:LmbE family N-acetylglucosaminyl deacetylase